MTTDGENPEQDAQCWANLPGPIKVIVYTSLREAALKYIRDTAMAQVLRGLTTESTRTSALEDAHALIAVGFNIAIAELEDADLDLCLDCGGYHDTEEPHVDKKDLS